MTMPPPAPLRPSLVQQIVDLPQGGHIAYVETGPVSGFDDSDPPLVFVHGSLCDFRYWTPQLEALSVHRRVVCVSLPHYFPVGEQPAGEGFSIQSHVEALIGLFKTRHWTDIALVGHSRGGCVAFHLASQRPDFLGQLVLADPGGSMPTFNPDGSPKPALTQAYPETDPRVQATRRIEAGEVNAGVAQFVDAVSRPGFWDRSSPEFQQMALDNAQTLSLQIRDVLPLYTRELAARVSTPTLLLNGDKSPKPFLSTAHTLAAWMPYARRELIAGASHGMNLTHANAFNQLVLDFVGTLVS